jgi:hypothetical protein
MNVYAGIVLDADVPDDYCNHINSATDVAGDPLNPVVDDQGGHGRSCVKSKSRFALPPSVPAPHAVGSLPGRCARAARLDVALERLTQRRRVALARVDLVVRPPSRPLRRHPDRRSASRGLLTPPPLAFSQARRRYGRRVHPPSHRTAASSVRAMSADLPRVSPGPIWRHRRVIGDVRGLFARVDGPADIPAGDRLRHAWRGC